MRTIGFRGRVGAPAAPPPPDWWAEAFARRQRRLRAVLLRHLAAAGGREITTTMARQFAAHFEGDEVGYALASLCADGLVECRPAAEPVAVGRSATVNRAYWRLADAPAREG